MRESTIWKRFVRTTESGDLDAQQTEYMPTICKSFSLGLHLSDLDNLALARFRTMVECPAHSRPV